MIYLHKVRLVTIGPGLVNTNIFTNMFFWLINHIGYYRGDALSRYDRASERFIARGELIVNRIFIR